jgi:guanylate kinase
VTSRSPRKGEKDGVHYYFLPEAQFKKLIKEDSLMEWARVYGNYYGTPLKQVEEKRAQGLDVILEIDTQGAKQIREHIKEAILIFLLPPSWEELWNRIKGRGTEEPEVMKERYLAAYGELKEIWYYDYVVYNYNVDDAVEKIRAIISAEKCRVERNKKILEKLSEERW